MATVNCPVVLSISGSSGETEVVVTETSENEPTPRQRALGKMKTVIDTDNYQVLPAEFTSQGVTPFRHLTQRYLLESGQEWKSFQTSIKDRFRYESKTFWGKRDLFGQDSQTVEAGKFTYINSGVFERQNRGEVVHGVPYKIRSVGEQVQDSREEVQGSFLRDFYKKQTIIIQARSAFFSRRDMNVIWNQSFWEFWVHGLIPVLPGIVAPGNNVIPKLFDTTKTFVDHSFRISAPLFPKELMKLNGLPKPAVVTTDMEYNFYIKQYESALAHIVSTGRGREMVLPNIYAFLVEKKSQNKDADQSIFWKLITLNNQIEEVSVDVLNDRGRKIAEEDTGQYFDKWGRAYLKAASGVIGQAKLQEIQRKYSRIIFSPSDIEIFKSFNEKRFLFPMYVDFEFSTDRQTLLADGIKEAQLGTSLMRAVMENPQETEDDPKYRPHLSSFRIATELITGTQTVDKIVEVEDPKQRKVLDIVAWWTAFKNRQTENNKSSVVLGTSLPEIFVSEDPQYRFVQTLLSLIFSGKIRNTLNGRLRNFEDIMNGKHAYSETIFYKISKYRINPSTDEPRPIPVQDFFIPNSSELDLFRFIDTQVVFDRKYRYIAYAYEMVFGTEYEYAPLQGIPEFTINENAVVDVYTRPSIQLIEVPIFSFDTQVRDKPPLPPQVDIIPYRNVNNNVLINLSVNSGELTAQPIAFDASEQGKHNELRRIHDLEPTDPIQFKGDDPIDFFEVYRTTVHPKSYSDFVGKRHIEVDTEVLNPGGKQIGLAALSSAATVDFIRPNVKYYYTFRSVDIRGNISNPTAVFKFEMVENSGAIYPVLEVVGFDPPKKNEENKNFKKYIHISPAPIQREVNITNELTIDTAEDAIVELGIAGEKLFSTYPNKRKIKVRLTSKSTGKKIDINLNFSHRHTS